MSECPLCNSEEYDGIKEVCSDCGYYNESKHHGSLADREQEWDRRLEREWERSARF